MDHGDYLLFLDSLDIELGKFLEHGMLLCLLDELPDLRPAPIVPGLVAVGRDQPVELLQGLPLSTLGIIRTSATSASPD